MSVKFYFKINYINMNSKNYIYIGVALVIVILTAVLMTNKGNSPDNDLEILTSASPTPTIEPSPTPSDNSLPQQSKNIQPKPTPTLIFEVIPSYEVVAELFQEEGRRFVVNDSCTEIVPSNLTLPNNIQVMFDNTDSSLRHIITIGGREYILEAGEWFMPILSSPTVPVRWQIFCGQMELGEIELVK